MQHPLRQLRCADIYQEHGYLVRLTKRPRGEGAGFEVFGRLPTEREPQWAPETIFAAR